MMSRYTCPLPTLACLLLMTACSPSQKPEGTLDTVLAFEPGQEDAIRTALINITDGTEIVLQEGVYHFDKLSIQGPVNQVIFRGRHPEKTIIDFSGQSSGVKACGWTT